MQELLEQIERMIVSCSKRDLVPSAEFVDDLLDLRAELSAYAAAEQFDNMATPTPV